MEATHTAEVGGLQIGYVQAGHGPPVVLLHGYVGDGLTTWRPQIDVLSEEFTVVAWDAPGAGRSSDPPESFGLAGYADCLARFIRELNLDRPHVMGLSFGGVLALGYCSRYPTALASLILVSAYAGWRGSLPVDAAEQRLQQALMLADATPQDFRNALLPTMFCDRPSPEIIDNFGSALSRFHPAGFRAMARASAEDVRDSLARVNVPALLVYGDHDIRAPLAIAERLHAEIPRSSLVVLPGAGHVCNLEAPGRFNEAVQDFLRATRQ